MQISVTIDRENGKKTVNLDKNSSVSDLLKSLNINPVTVIVARNDNLIMESEKLDENDQIWIFSVISGG